MVSYPDHVPDADKTAVNADHVQLHDTTTDAVQVLDGRIGALETAQLDVDLAATPVDFPLNAEILGRAGSGGPFVRGRVQAVVASPTTSGTSGTSGSSSNPTTTPTTPSTATPAGVAGSWALAFEDTFALGSLNGQVWKPAEPWQSAPGYVQGPQAYNPLPPTAAVLAVAGDSLKVSAALQSIAVGGTTYPVQAAEINTRLSYAFTRGYIEGRFKVPTGADLWPAFWLLGNGTGANGWPGTGEIDIFEFVNNGADDGRMFLTIHGKDASGNHAQLAHSPVVVPSFGSVPWITVGLLRTANYLALFLNGSCVDRINRTETFPGGSALTAALFDDPMHVRIGMSDGGWGDNPGASPAAGSLEVDYVRAWTGTVDPAVVLTPAAPSGGGGSSAQLLSNGDFEAGTTGWSPLGTATLAPATTPVHGGTKLAKVTATAAGTVGIIAASPLPVVVPGHSFTFTAWVDTAAARTVEMLIDFGTGSSYISTVSGSTTTSATAWKQVTLTGTVPAGAAIADPYVRVVGAANGEATYFDDFILAS